MLIDSRTAHLVAIGFVFVTGRHVYKALESEAQRKEQTDNPSLCEKAQP
jgi:hypothetical protein